MGHGRSRSLCVEGLNVWELGADVECTVVAIERVLIADFASFRRRLDSLADDFVFWEGHPCHVVSLLWVWLKRFERQIFKIGHVCCITFLFSQEQSEISFFRGYDIQLACRGDRRTLELASA